jgi:hypothetical protein
MVTEVSCVFAVGPVTALTPPTTLLDPIRLNCNPISPTAQVLLIIPQASLDNTRSSPAPAYQPVLLLFCPRVVERTRCPGCC